MTSFLWYVALQENHKGFLTINFLDVGQGDAIYIQAPNGNDILIDGGPSRILLSALSAVTPFYKRSLGMILVTNPDADHYSGFIDLLNHTKVGMEFESGTISSTPTYSFFQTKLKEKNVSQALIHKGMNIVLDQSRNVHIIIFFPDRDVSKETSNNGSVVAKLVYGNTSVMLQGDATAKVESHLLKTESVNLKADILKVGHHGSKTSSVDRYLNEVAPRWGIISAGLNNKYGHPDPETINTLNKYDVQILKTMDIGTITFQSDGKVWKQK